MLSSQETSTVKWRTFQIPLGSLTSLVLMTYISQLLLTLLISLTHILLCPSRLLESCHYLELFPLLKLQFNHCSPPPSKTFIQLLPSYYFFSLIMTSPNPPLSPNMSPLPITACLVFTSFATIVATALVTAISKNN